MTPLNNDTNSQFVGANIYQRLGYLLKRFEETERSVIAKLNESHELRIDIQRLAKQGGPVVEDWLRGELWSRGKDGSGVWNR
jgi:hypothetical protein